MHEWLLSVLPRDLAGAWWVGILELAARIAVAVASFLAARWVALRVIRGLVERSAESRNSSRIRTLGGLMQSASTYGLLIITVITLLSDLGVNVTALVTGAGLAGLALSFGAQRLVRDVLTGFFLLLEDQLRVGEWVTLVGGPGIPQFTGEVEEIGLRTTRLRDELGKWVTIGNGDVVAVINHSRSPVLVRVELTVAADVNIDSVRGALEQGALPEDRFAGPAVLEGSTELTSESRKLRIAAPAQPGPSTSSELLLRDLVAEFLRQSGVELK